MITLREYSEKISSMWLYELNGNDTPDTVSFGSAKEFWWQCNNNPKHIFKKEVYKMFNRRKKTPIGCIYCEAEHPTPFPGETDFFTICPKARDMWDYDKNTGFDMDRINAGSAANIWFKCENSHNFQRTICNFVSNQTCPICRISDNVIAKFPHLVRQWHYEKNKTIDINITSANAKKTVWWKCKKCNYEWQAQIASRRASKGECPCCETRTVVKAGATDLFSIYPELKDEYNYERNTDVDIETLSVTTKISVWWKCKDAGHEWLISPAGRLKTNNKQRILSKCPYCLGTKRNKSYADEYPELTKKYIEDKNKYSFHDINHIYREHKYWWHCSLCGNDFESTVGAMIRSRNTYAKGCSYCSGKKVKRESSFAYLHPEIMNEFDWNHNKLNPYEVTEKSGKSARWICKNNPEHVWKATFYQRSLGMGSCNICRTYNYEKHFYEVYPEFEQYYDTEKNTRPFSSYSISSNESVWWKCIKGHSFQRTFYHANNIGIFKCAVCENLLLKKGDNDLASQYPHLAEEFDSEKNGITPDNILITSSNPDTWWKCKYGHEFQRTVNHRIRISDNCPICNRTTIVKGINDFQHAYPKIAFVWDYDKNDKKPDEISDYCKDKFYFLCAKGHKYSTQLPTIIANDFECLICNERILQKGTNTLLDTDFALAQEFSPNEERTPDEFRKSSSYKILWMCPVCQGEYYYPINERKVGDDACPYCNNRRTLGGFNTLDATNEKLAAEWSVNNTRPVTDFFETSTYYALWICPTCAGEYGARICDREVGDDSCPYCRNQKVLAGWNSLADTHKDLCMEWSSKNTRFPSEFMKSNIYYATWKCPTCTGEYEARICDREVGDNSCPYCRNSKVLPGYNSFKQKHADLMEEWNYMYNYLLINPDNILDSHTGNVWWICNKCKYNYQMSPQKKVYYQTRHMKSCPKCKGLRQKRKYYL